MNIILNIIQANIALILILLSSLVIILTVWIIFLQLEIRKTTNKISEFFAGGKVSNLEELLTNQSQTLKLLDKDIQELYNISNQVHSLAQKGIHKVGLIRFNPFKDVGGDQSFAIALLDGKNNGVTLSSLYTREGTRIYSKAINSGQSEKHPLTEEEKKVIETAINTPVFKKADTK